MRPRIYRSTPQLYLALLRGDPEGFIAGLDGPAVIDQLQRAAGSRMSSGRSRESGISTLPKTSDCGRQAEH